METNNSDTNCKVFYFDLYGVRQAKYDFLFDNDIKSVEWEELKPSSANYFFSMKNFDEIVNYEKGYKIDSIFNTFSSGVKTHRDHLVIDEDQTNLQNRIKRFYSLNKDAIEKEFGVTDTRDWKIIEAINNGSFNSKDTRKCFYRPFDIRNIHYDLNLIERGTSRYNLMKNFFSNNYGLCTVRQINGNNWQHVCVANHIIDMCSVSIKSKETTYVFPLNIIPDADNNNDLLDNEGLFQQEINTNFTPAFKQYIQSKYKEAYTPEQILGYIYAVLHSPTYRTKYIEFLKIDFPRVHFTDDEELFRELSALGFELIEHHLLKKSYAQNICRINGSGDNFKVEKVAFEKINPADDPEAKFMERATGESLGRVWINKERYFEPIPESIWNFYIGGYQVLDKWLKERKKHEITLTSEDVQHFIKVVNVLDYTITAMQKIDDLTKEWI